MARRWTLARAASLAWTMRRRETESLSWTLILLIRVVEGAMVGGGVVERRTAATRGVLHGWWTSSDSMLALTFLEGQRGTHIVASGIELEVTINDAERADCMLRGSIELV